jgi:hypothetical protein
MSTRPSAARRVDPACRAHARVPLGRALRDWPDWMIGSAGLAVFAVAVQAILVAVRGWAVPSHLWSAASVFALASMAAHALVRAAIAGWRRDAIAALRCAGAAAGLLACLAAVALLGGASRAECGCGFDDPPAAAAGDGR